jgi:ubiquinone/menaquinone biosynthesis C-methylase UbiE
MKYYIFGAGDCGKRFAKVAAGRIDICAFIDNYYGGNVEIEGLWGRECINLKQFEERRKEKSIIFVAAYTNEKYTQITSMLEDLGLHEDVDFFDAVGASYDTEVYFAQFKYYPTYCVSAIDNIIELFEKWKPREALEIKRVVKYHKSAIFNLFVSQLNKYVKDDMKIADLGSGYGFYSGLIDSFHCNVTIDAVDFDSERVEFLKILSDKFNSISKFSVMQGDICELTALFDNTYDITMAVLVLSLVSDIDKALCEIGRITRHGGLIVIVLSDVTSPGRMDFYENHGLSMNFDATFDNVITIMNNNGMNLIFKQPMFIYNECVRPNGAKPTMIFLIFKK